jgi:hypothetical protein
LLKAIACRYNRLGVYAITSTIIRDGVFKQCFIAPAPYISAFKYIKPVLILNSIYTKSTFRMDLFIAAIRGFNNQTLLIA